MLKADQITPQAELASVRVAAECQGSTGCLDCINSGSWLMCQQQAHALWRITKDSLRIGPMSGEGALIFGAIRIGHAADDQSRCFGRW